MEFRVGKARPVENFTAGMFLVDARATSDTPAMVMRERQ